MLRIRSVASFFSLCFAINFVLGSSDVVGQSPPGEYDYDRIVSENRKNLHESRKIEITRIIREASDWASQKSEIDQVFSQLESQWNKKLTEFKERIVEQKSLDVLKKYLLQLAKTRVAEPNTDQPSKPIETLIGEASLGERLVGEIQDSDWLETEISRSKLFEGGAAQRPSREVLDSLKMQIVTPSLYGKAVSELLNLKKRDLEADWLKNSAQPNASLVFEDIRGFLEEDVLSFVDEIQRTHGPINLSGELSFIPEPSDVIFDLARLSPQDARAFHFSHQPGSYLGVHQEWGLANDDLFKQVVARKTSEAAQIRAVNTVNYLHLKITQFSFARANQIQRLNFEVSSDSRISELRMCLREVILKGEWE